MSGGQLGNEQLGSLILGGEPLVADCSIEQGIWRLLTDNIETPIYRRRPQSAELPCITYEVTRVEYDNWLTGKAGLARATFEFSIWSRDYDDLAEIGLSIRNVLDAFSGMAKTRVVLTALHQAEHDEIEAPDDATAKCVYCRVQEYEVLYLE